MVPPGLAELEQLHVESNSDTFSRLHTLELANSRSDNTRKHVVRSHVHMQHTHDVDTYSIL